MTTPRDPDVTIADWLDDGPDALPPITRQVLVSSIHLTPQRRDWLGWSPWRIPIMNGNAPRLAIAAAIGLLVLVVGGIYLGNNSGSGGVGGQPPAATPTPTPTAEASAAVTPRIVRANTADTTGWVPFVSDRYGYQGSRPPNTEFHPASSDWSLDLTSTDAETATDWFTVGSPDDLVAIFGFAADVPAGMTEDGWIAAAGLRPPADAPCRASETWETVIVDGHEGRFNRQPAAAEGNDCQATYAYVFIDDRVYVFAEGYGRYPELLKGFLATVRFTDVDPSFAPATPSP